ncbi:conserved Plasmodium protein, unknown function [Plasmodium knowlesi strain H]|uniref:Uncharacterized protein n=3 Tax=Plasmodium knowlesi TaxID=5850 RepID=A0A5K1VRS5_PLAKH|nr:conserved protein, unknown function [Plasmodium knowlesi strain H]OTN66101.1 Uncharacterized protein PKNOH_S100034000 [Plasmodium knowlesi]CAA9987705.1 conserved protein, unknown function [Plasmodium knowlesi strain H]SBO26926.1 conserved Plasmodium protein, unknown function [Plasmodium knowlesi strain H]SBO29617.1 conserved Plasmodium protein, unknown function [Plasmodium knowlesi strain H]VVS77179.1 conserved protein, unknown function [Plasmodium knowlesi strain H]|eukprot:XP_002258703.1 hypothetical protein, conserved in Plasmodium species [Plasmodium knowlesi strain H]
MNFIKTHIYEQEYTNEGIKEHEKDARSAKEIDENKRLKELPEFKRDHQFLSLSEQLELKKNNNNGTGTLGKDDEAGLVNIYDMPNMTEEYAEYYDNYAKHDNYSIEKIREREKEVEFEFKEAIKNYAKKKELKEKEDEVDLLKEESNHVNLSEIKKNIIKKKKIIPMKTSVKAIIKTKKKNAISSPKGDHSNVKKVSTPEKNSLLLGYSDYSDE